MKAPAFFHPSNARNKGALMEVRAELGWEGYGAAWAILEQIASGISRTIPMHNLRQTVAGMGMERKLFLDVTRILKAHGCIDTKSMYDEEFDMQMYHLYSPMLEQQLLNKELQHMARVLSSSDRIKRPAIPSDVRRKVLASGCCAYCGATEELQVDHIYPYSKGGAHSIENFQPLCRACNYAKRDKTEEEYFALIGRVNG